VCARRDSNPHARRHQDLNLARLAWGVVVAAGQHLRQVDLGDRVFFDPEDRAEVELQAVTYLLLREQAVKSLDMDAVRAQDAARPAWAAMAFHRFLESIPRAPCLRLNDRIRI